MIESLFSDQTVSWVRIANGTNKNVTETSEEIPSENIDSSISTGKLVALAKPRPKLVVNLSSFSVLINERNGKILIHNHSITFVLKCQNS